MVASEINLQLSGAKTMTKEQKNIKANKKKPAMTQKEKKAAKRAKKESKVLLAFDKTS